jgi:hypothetical protein
VKGKPTATPEQLKSALLAWEKERGYLDRLARLFEEPQGTQEPSHEAGS